MAAYPFNSQVLTLPDGAMCIVAPVESRRARRRRGRSSSGCWPRTTRCSEVHYLDVRQSMNNGGGPACLRQRIRLTDEERGGGEGAACSSTPALRADLEAWVAEHYRDRLGACGPRGPGAGARVA